MIAEAIDKLRALVENANRPEVFRLPGQPCGQVMIRQGNIVVKHYLDKPHPAITMETFESFVELVKAYKYDQDHERTPVVPFAVFHNLNEVVLQMDTVSGLGTADLPLMSSKEYQFFAARRTTPAVGMAEFRRVLRTVLNQSKPPEEMERFIRIVSQVQYGSQEEDHTHLDRGRESMGATVAKTMESAIGMPDEHQIFVVRRYDTRDHYVQFPLTCLLDPMVSERQWSLAPLENSWCNYEGNVLAQTHERLVAALPGVPIYEGQWSPDVLIDPAAAVGQLDYAYDAGSG